MAANAQLLRASSLAQMDKKQDARRAIQEALRLRPALNRGMGWLDKHPALSTWDEGLKDRYLAGLRMAGLGAGGAIGSSAQADREMIAASSRIR